MLQDMIKKYSSNTIGIGSSVAYAESLLNADETVLYAWFGAVFCCNCGNRFDNDVIPLSQKKAAVFVLSDRRVLCCYKSLLTTFNYSIDLIDIAELRFNKNLVLSSQIIVRVNFDNYYIDVNATYIKEIFAAMSDNHNRIKETAPKSKKKKGGVTSLEYKAIVYSKTPKPKDIYKEFHTKVAGVSFKNDDGSDRQKIVSKCKVGQDVYFRPVPTNEFPQAIGVFTSKGKQLGHVSASVAKDLIFLYPNNPAKVTISDITGGNGKTYGCNLFIQIIKLK